MILSDRSFAARWDSSSPFVPHFEAAAEERHEASPPQDERCAADHEAIHADGYAAGFAAGMAEHAARQDRLADALDALAPVPALALEQALAGIVHDLVARIIHAAPVSAQELRPRIAEALACLPEAQAACLHLHPDDMALLADAPLAVTLMPDPALMPGAIRLSHGERTVLHGRETALAALADALHLGADSEGGIPC